MKSFISCKNVLYRTIVLQLNELNCEAAINLNSGESSAMVVESNNIIKLSDLGNRVVWLLI